MREVQRNFFFFLIRIILLKTNYFMPNKKICTKKPKELQKTKDTCTRRERLYKHWNELSRRKAPS